ncbi:hypothetical protein HPY06_14575 [Vibrio cholerae]|uniref:hypothetical protein n=1 Tax=Vibrio cholerae TaxID=666 RepID=UPI0015832195|nr:hypothetical protein [Vibrio cholerae]QKU87373.1 hypothetical protein HPY06_14575 [Vibrio cholerae]HDB1450806.1 hypothetical protein [Vibrio cholerae]
MSPEEIELYKDALKIGIPALVGLSAGLVPYFIEKRKVAIQKTIEDDKAKRALVISFAEALSEYQGSSRAYISYLVSSRYNAGEGWGEIIGSASQKMADNEVNRVKAKSLAGIVGNTEVVNALLEYDKCITDVMSLLVKSQLLIDDKTEKEQVLKLEVAERKLLHSLNRLL